MQVYFANVHPKFPGGGKMSQYLNSLSIGDTVDVRGPAGKVTYLGRGKLRVKLPGKPEQMRHAKKIGLIAGGTGGRSHDVRLESCDIMSSTSPTVLGVMWFIVRVGSHHWRSSVFSSCTMAASTTSTLVHQSKSCCILNTVKSHGGHMTLPSRNHPHAADH